MYGFRNKVRKLAEGIRHINTLGPLMAVLAPHAVVYSGNIERLRRFERHRVELFVAWEAVLQHGDRVIIIVNLQIARVG